MCRWKSSLLFVALAGCNPDRWSNYELYFQVEGNSEIEGGAPICQVATSARHVLFVGGSSTGTTCWLPNDGKSFRFARNVPASKFVLQRPEVPALFNPVHVEGEGDDLVALDALRGLAWWHAGPFSSDGDVDAEDVPVLKGVFRPQAWEVGSFVDVAVSGGVAWVVESYGLLGALHRVDLAGAFAGEPGAVVSAQLTGLPISVDVLGGGAVVVMNMTGDHLQVFDAAANPVGDLALVAPPDGMKVGGDIAWVSGNRRVFAVDLTSPSAPVYVDDEGTETVDEANNVMHASGEMFFLASGADQVSMAWDGGRPDHPKAVGGFHVGNGTFDIDTNGQVLLLATGNHGLQLWGPWRDWPEDTAAQ